MPLLITRITYHLVMVDSRKNKSDVIIAPRKSESEIVYLRDLYLRVCASPGVTFIAEQREFAGVELIRSKVIK